MFWENPAVVGLILAIPTVALAYIGYRRSIPRDKAAAQVGVDAGHIGLITALQADNQDLRDELRALRGEHAAEVRALRKDYADLREGLGLVQARLEVVEAENARLERELAKINGTTSSGQ